MGPRGITTLRPVAQGRASPSCWRRGRTCRWRWNTDCVASSPREVMMLHAPNSAASSAARPIVAADTAGSTPTSATWVLGMTRVCPAVTADKGTMARESGHRRTTRAGARPATMAQNGHSPGDTRRPSAGLCSDRSVVTFGFPRLPGRTEHRPAPPPGAESSGQADNGAGQPRGERCAADLRPRRKTYPRRDRTNERPYEGAARPGRLPTTSNRRTSGRASAIGYMRRGISRTTWRGRGVTFPGYRSGPRAPPLQAGSGQ